MREKSPPASHPKQPASCKIVLQATREDVQWRGKIKMHIHSRYKSISSGLDEHVNSYLFLDMQ